MADGFKALSKALSNHAKGAVAAWPKTAPLLVTAGKDVMALHESGKVSDTTLPALESNARQIAGLLKALGEKEKPGSTVINTVTYTRALAMRAVEETGVKTTLAALSETNWKKDLGALRPDADSTSGSTGNACLEALNDINDGICAEFLNAKPTVLYSTACEWAGHLEDFSDVVGELAETALPYVRILVTGVRRLYRMFCAMREMKELSEKVGARMQVLMDVLTSRKVLELIAAKAATKKVLIDVVMLIEGCNKMLEQYANRWTITKFFVAIATKERVEEAGRNITAQLTELHTLVSFHSMADQKEKLEDILKEVKDRRPGPQAQASPGGISPVYLRKALDEMAFKLQDAKGADQAKLNAKIDGLARGMETRTAQSCAAVDKAVKCLEAEAKKFEQATGTVLKAAATVESAALEAGNASKQAQEVLTQMQEELGKMEGWRRDVRQDIRVTMKMALQEAYAQDVAQRDVASPTAPTASLTAVDWMTYGRRASAGNGEVVVNGEVVTAAGCFAKSASMDPASHEAFALLGEALGDGKADVGGSLLSAQQALVKAVELKPSFSRGWRLLAAALDTDTVTVGGKEHTAVTACVASLEGDTAALPKASVASSWVMLATLMGDAGDDSVKVGSKTVTRKDCYAQAIKTAPDSPAAWVGLSDSVGDSEQTEVAGKQLSRFETLTQALMLTPKSGDVWRALAAYAEEQDGTIPLPDVPSIGVKGSYGPVSCYRMALIHGARDAPAWAGMAKLMHRRKVDLHKTGDADLGNVTMLSCAVKAVEAEPHNGAYWVLLADAMEKDSTRPPAKVSGKSMTWKEVATAAVTCASPVKSSDAYAMLALAMKGDDTVTLDGRKHTRMEVATKAAEMPNTTGAGLYAVYVALPKGKSATIRGKTLNEVALLDECLQVSPQTAKFWVSRARFLDVGSKTKVTAGGRTFSRYGMLKHALSLNRRNANAWGLIALEFASNEFASFPGFTNKFKRINCLMEACSLNPKLYHLELLLQDMTATNVGSVTIKGDKWTTDVVRSKIKAPK